MCADSGAELSDFFDEHPREVVTFILQDGMSVADTEAVFEASELASRAYAHPGGAWPTLGELIDAGTPLVVASESSGPPPTWYHHVWDIAFDTDTSAEEIVKIQEQKVKESPEKAKLYGVKNVYVSGEGNNKLWAIAFEGEGMWKQVKGLLCLKADLKTIHRITFYEQEETPGLGAKIADAPFQNGFKDKSIYDSSGKPGIVLKRAGTPSSENNAIDAITGATITSGKVKDMLNKLIENIAKAQSSEVSYVR